MSEVLDFASFGGPVFVGRDNGIEARKRFKIEKYDTEASQVIIKIDPNTYSVNSSFFLGLFGTSLKYFGSKESFLEHYRFDAPDHVMKTLYSVLETSFKSRGTLSLEEKK